MARPVCISTPLAPRHSGRALERKPMSTLTILLLLTLTEAAFAQSNIYSLRIVSHTPFYERIFLPKGNILRPSTLRGIDDLKASEHYAGTNRIDGIFANPSLERTNNFYASCLSELPLSDLSLRCPG